MVRSRVTKSMAEPRSLVSVIIPAFNVAAYVEEALESVARQTLRPFEVIVVDDGSTDGTSALLERLRVEKEGLWHPLTIVHQENKGESAARNVALRQARGAFVGLLDADDRWHPRMLERSLAVLEAHDEADVTFAWFRTIDADGRPTGWIGRPSIDSITFESAFAGPGIIPSVVVARRDALLRVGGYDETLRACQNFDLWLRLRASRATALRCVPEVLIDYRKHPDQITLDWERMVENWERVISRERRRCPAFTEAAEREARACHRLNVAARVCEAGAGRPARRLLIEAWSQHPAVVALQWQGWTVTAAVLLASLPVAIGAPLFRAIRWSRRKLALLHMTRRRTTRSTTSPGPRSSSSSM
jgi:GT2 family glycosyltransferase